MLWLLRHAEAADGVPDDQRPLTERGVRQAEAAGRALARLGEPVDICLSSPKLRALQTAERACEPLGIEIRTWPRLTTYIEEPGSPTSKRRLPAGAVSKLMTPPRDSSSDWGRDWKIGTFLRTSKVSITRPLRALLYQEDGHCAAGRAKLGA